MKNRIQIIAPSFQGPNSNEALEQFTKILKERNFEVKYTKGLSCGYHFYSNTLEERLKDLRGAILDPTVDIIWTFRGGYGASELAIQYLDIKPSHHKTLIGFSDITVLHGLFNNIYKMQSIHGSGVTSLLGKQAKHLDDIILILRGEEVKIALKPFNKKADGLYIESSVAGGNISLLATMIGTKLHPVTKDKILLLEDVGEKGYKIRRLLEHFSQAGLLEEVAAIILGDFTESDEHLDFAFEDFFSRHQHIPVFRAEGIGHGETNIPLMFGSKAIIENGLLRVSS